MVLYRRKELYEKMKDRYKFPILTTEEVERFVTLVKQSLPVPYDKYFKAKPFEDKT